MYNKFTHDTDTNTNLANLIAIHHKFQNYHETYSGVSSGIT